MGKASQSKAARREIVDGRTFSRPPVRIMVGMPSLGGLISIQTATSLLGLTLPGNTLRMSFPTGLPVDRARNMIAAEALEPDERGQSYTHLLFLDDDSVPPRETLPRLLSHGLALVSGLVYRREVVSTPAFITERDAAGVRENWTPGDLLSVYAVGAACLLLETSMLKRMRDELPLDRDPDGVPQWFRCASEYAQAGEDIDFCEKAARLGYVPVVDTGLLVWHWSNTERRAYPLDKWREFTRHGTTTWQTPNGPHVWRMRG